MNTLLLYHLALLFASKSEIRFGNVCKKGGMHMKVDLPSDDEYIFTAYITVKGKRIYASQYGLKAFYIRVKRKD